LPLVEGGHQERERRGGTENTIGIAGFGAAAAAIDLAAWPRVTELGARLEAGLVELGARIHGVGDPIGDPIVRPDHAMGPTVGIDGTPMFATEGERIGGTINAAFSGVRGESIVIALDLAGISCSTGAACTSGSIQPSKVLLALGQSPEQAREAVRFSLGTPTTTNDIDAVLAALPPILVRARR
jgi:cysteine desulfurase